MCCAPRAWEERVPPWMRGAGRGWVTAEYGMLPRSTGERMRREASTGRQSGRTLEIQRLIGRSLRAIVDLEKLGERQITVDCDVLQADGGTRTASITGAWVALYDCIHWMKAREMVADGVLTDQIAAISCGIYEGNPVCDLDYAEDSEAETGRQFRHDRLRRHRRGPGDRRGCAVRRGVVSDHDGAGRRRHRPAPVPAEIAVG